MFPLVAQASIFSLKKQIALGRGLHENFVFYVKNKKIFQGTCSIVLIFFLLCTKRERVK